MAIDDCTRLAYVEILADERAITAVAFLRRALAFYAGHGVSVERAMTDNGSACKSTIHAVAAAPSASATCARGPTGPRTNGEAERFIKTLIAGWNDSATYGSTAERAGALDGWIYHYNRHRPHGALSHKPPVARLNERNNLAGSYS